MNRRMFLLATAASTTLPAIARAQTPGATPQLESPDLRARNCLTALRAVSPVDVLAALESSPINQPALSEVAERSAFPIAWADFSDSDLVSSLGGVAIELDGGAVNNPVTLGSYIVYESAEIAYHEFVRKMGDAYDNPSLASSSAGTNTWIFSENDTELAVARIGYVMIAADLTTNPAGIEGMIAHLTEVATSIA